MSMATALPKTQPGANIGADLSEDTAISVRNLKTHFFLEEGTLKAVDNVSFDVKNGATVGIIGESGSGKSVTARSILRIVPKPGRIVGGEILAKSSTLGVVDMAKLKESGEKIRSVRGKDVAMIFQEPMTSLSPVHTVGNQIVEAILIHSDRSSKEARAYAIDMLAQVGISAPRQRIDEYPFQLSGGMRQRVMIAMALSCNPRVLIADEPTTALDVTVQAQILDLMEDLQEKFGMAIMYITHDLGVIAGIADEINVMYLGKVVEKATATELFKNPQHPYTKGLLKSIPDFNSVKGSRLNPIEGNVPVPLNLPVRCGFYGRCPVAIEGLCDRALPALVSDGSGHAARCFQVHDEVEESQDE